VDGPKLGRGEGRLTIERLAQHVEHPAQDSRPYWDLDASPRPPNRQAASQAVGVSQRAIVRTVFAPRSRWTSRSTGRRPSATLRTS
jgi:hypothetical protein